MRRVPCVRESKLPPNGGWRGVSGPEHFGRSHELPPVTDGVFSGENIRPHRTAEERDEHKSWYKWAPTCSNRRWNVWFFVFFLNAETDGGSSILQSDNSPQKLFWDASWEFSDWLLQGCFSKHIITEIIKLLLWHNDLPGVRNGSAAAWCVVFQ